MLFLHNYINQGQSAMQRGSNLSQSSTGQMPFAHQSCNSHRVTTYGKSQVLQPVKKVPGLGSEHNLNLEKVDYPTRGYRNIPSKDGELRKRSDLQGLVLTLGGPGSGHLSWALLYIDDGGSHHFGMVPSFCFASSVVKFSWNYYAYISNCQILFRIFTLW